MKNKKLFPIIFLLTIIVIAIISIIWTNLYINPQKTNNQDFTPEEEINSKDFSKTTITLYFLDSSNNHLKSEGRIINSSELLENPYKKIIEYLIEGPISNSLTNVFPTDTKILNATIDKNTVILNFSKELLNFENDEQKYNIINCILNSLAELNEVNSIKIKIDGEPTDSFNEEYFKIY